MMDRLIVENQVILMYALVELLPDKDSDLVRQIDDQIDKSERHLAALAVVGRDVRNAADPV